MKAFFVSYNQALTDRVNRMLDEHGVRGFTRWALTEGRGSYDGEPHYGTHAWPSMNSSILAIVEDEKVPVLLEALREIDYTTKQQGSRAFVWDITQMMYAFCREKSQSAAHPKKLTHRGCTSCTIPDGLLLRCTIISLTSLTSLNSLIHQTKKAVQDYPKLLRLLCCDVSC